MEKKIGQNNRYSLLDQIRGFAVFLMIVFHIFYDLSSYGYLKIDFNKDFFWYLFPRVIVFLFLFSVGMSLPLVNLPKINWKKYWIRILKISFFALLISISTYIMFPKTWVYFGTLHCIALTSIMALPFLKLPKTSLLIALVLLLPSMIFNINIPWFTLGHKSMDYIAPFPWFGVVTLGIFAYHFNFHKYDTSNFFLNKPLSFLGRYALWIYLVHQPLIFGIISLIYKAQH